MHTYLQPLGRHVAPRSDEGVSHGIDELAGDAKIAYLDLPLCIDENIAWLDVPIRKRNTSLV